MVPLSLVNGLVYPYATIGLLMMYLLGRNLYTSGYYEKEGAFNKKRMIGSGLCNIAHVGTLLITMGVGINIARGKLTLEQFTAASVSTAATK